MKLNQPLVLLLLLFVYINTAGQKPEPAIHLKKGSIYTKPNLSPSYIDSFNKSVKRTNGNGFALLQFESIPTDAEKKLLAVNEMDLLDYIPDNAYTISFRGNINLSILKRLKVKALLHLEPEQKMHPAFTNGQMPSWAVKIPGTINVWISFPKTFSSTEVIAYLKEKNIDVLSSQHQQYRILEIRIAQSRLTELASFLLSNMFNRLHRKINR